MAHVSQVSHFMYQRINVTFSVCMLVANFIFELVYILTIDEVVITLFDPRCILLLYFKAVVLCGERH